MRYLEIAAMEAFLFVRGLLFRGNAHDCPVCGTRIRAFTQGGGSFRRRRRGYCPRCNSKARHRRVWIHCRDETDLFDRPAIELLHVAPKYCLSRRIVRMPNVRYSAVDIVPRPLVTMIGDLTDLEVPSERYDAILCVHVLEHIVDDRSAIGEMWRVLRPGGWAVINVPVALDSPTFEDATLVTPNERRRAFGEADHVRVYGADLIDRLQDVGFEVELYRGDHLPESVIERHGLTTDEHVFHCVKPTGAVS